ncbi:SDR family oxidoreductase [Telmatocola sphagniphila]|uniref:SDR family oxidoreductase n=1 Tax=Telmatocola sphagniphila TaxID=1123043 RepID=A0A8E6B8F1_9BACT|nr:SDR family oxidoreductase [Telmatocola sphagniphila]QVL33661.1 SDR family oxidoreductase [Telmatocola sphagniphila]
MKIVITGATRGLGRALVAPLAKKGHTVYGCGRNEANIASLSAAFPAPHDFEALDVRDFRAVQRWASRILLSVGSPDLLINNAAVMTTPANLWEVSEEEFSRLIDVNIKGVANVIRAFVPAMVSQKRGVIVNLSSGWGRSTSPQVAPYCASKYAIEGLTKALAQELPPGMCAVPLNPGTIDTDMLRQAWADTASNYPKPEAWAEKAVQLLLGLSAKDNGKSLSVL